MPARFSLESLKIMFGVQWWQPPLLIHHRFAIRYELSWSTETDHRLDRFTIAYDRGREIIRHVLDFNDELYLAGHFYQLPDKSALQPLLKLFRELSDCGLPCPKRAEIQSEPDDEMVRSDFVTPIEQVHVDRVLWSMFAADQGIKPSCHEWLYIICPARRILIAPYDDRFMDIVATTPEPIETLNKSVSGGIMSSNGHSDDY